MVAENVPPRLDAIVTFAYAIGAASSVTRTIICEVTLDSSTTGLVI